MNGGAVLHALIALCYAKLATMALLKAMLCNTACEAKLSNTAKQSSAPLQNCKCKKATRKPQRKASELKNKASKQSLKLKLLSLNAA